MSGIVRVAAAVIFAADGRVLLAQRPAGKPYEGYWEFPGGKLERGESPAHALARELREELGIVVRDAAPWIVQQFVYPHAHVELHFFRVFAFDGEPHGHDGQAFAWQTPGRFDVEPLLPANTRVLAALSLPAVYGITCASDLGEERFMQAAGSALERGLRLVQVREKEWPAGRVDALARQLVPLAHAHGARILVNGDDDDARRWGADGVHWTAAKLKAAKTRPADLLVGASCHDAAELGRAADLGCDFAVLGPVRDTPSHPDARPLGWDRFQRVIEGVRLPVYAVGGLFEPDLREAIRCGAQGIAMRRGAWTAR